MIKAKEFWDVICNTFDYRFFSGIPCSDFDKLYKTMSSNFMHYIPAANEMVGLNLVNGVRLAGLNSALLIDLSSIDKLDFNFNLDSNIPLLILGSGQLSSSYRFKDSFSLLKLTSNITKSLEKAVSAIDNGHSCIIRIGKGDIS